jgi:hypothetical protein
LIDPAQLESEGLAIRADAGNRPVFFTANPDLDRVWAVMVAMAGEIAVLRARLDTHERLAAAAGAFDRGRVDAYRPGPEVAAERHTDRQALVERIFDPVVAELDSLLAGDRSAVAATGAAAQEK